MEAAEVLAAAPRPLPSVRHKEPPPIAKGKRTKRLRPHSPIPFTVVSTTNDDDVISVSSLEESTTTDELDTARCLILLSQGGPSPSPPPPHELITYIPIHQPRRAAVYTCKTCNRSFPSFQALGGHRASHKKPKDEKRAMEDDDFSSPSPRNKFSFHSLSLQLINTTPTSTSTSTATLFSPTVANKPSPRMHECSYCGAEFTSGQALGGHMRKHRAGPLIRLPEVVLPEPSIEEVELGGSSFELSLDLNLPAPEDEKEKSPMGSNRRFRTGFGHHYYTSIE